MDNDDDDDSQELPVVTSGEASKMLSKLQLFWTQQKDSYLAYHKQDNCPFAWSH
jgi:hypothetical protein